MIVFFPLLYFLDSSKGNDESCVCFFFYTFMAFLLILSDQCADQNSACSLLVSALELAGHGHFSDKINFLKRALFKDTHRGKNSRVINIYGFFLCK